MIRVFGGGSHACGDRGKSAPPSLQGSSSGCGPVRIVMRDGKRLDPPEIVYPVASEDECVPHTRRNERLIERAEQQLQHFAARGPRRGGRRAGERG